MNYYPSTSVKDSRVRAIRRLATVRSNFGLAFSRQEVQKIFNLSTTELDVILATREWSKELITEAVLDFYKREKRWPKSKDWTTANDLPNEQTATGIMNGVVTRYGRWRFRDSWREFSGTITSGWALIQEEIAKRKDLTPHMVLTLPNVTVRRKAIENYGYNKLKKAAKKVNKDEFGTLWKIPQKGDEDMCFVEVVNGTPEPDGTYAHFFLRVPPTVETAHQAVAWSYGTAVEEEYAGFTVGVRT